MNAAQLLRKAKLAQQEEVPDTMVAKATRVDAARILKLAREKGLVQATTQYAGVAS